MNCGGIKRKVAMLEDVRAGVRAMIPMLVCRDAAAEIDFCTTALGAVELARRTGPDGAVVHSTLKLGDALLMVHGEVSTLASRAPQPDGSSSVVIYLAVDNVDDIIARSVKAGAKVLIPVMQQMWGDRLGRIEDPSGHVWNIATPAGETMGLKV
jgi:PhnB protein